MQTEAKLELLYAEQALTAGENGLMSLHKQYMELNQKAIQRREDLRARIEEESAE